MPDDASGHDQILRFLGLAFAGADLVFEVDLDGRIAFALGAAERLTGHKDSKLIGMSWAELFSPQDAAFLDALLQGLGEADRRGPLRVALRRTDPDLPNRYAALSVFHLPQRAARVSCALSLGGTGLGASLTAPNGLMDRSAFADGFSALLEEAERAGLDVRLDLVELAGFGDTLTEMGAAEAQSKRQEIAAILRSESFAAFGAAEVAPDRFALVRPASACSAGLSERLRKSSGVEPVTAQLALEGASAAQNVRAMRYALDRYIEDGPAAVEKGFKAMVERTVRETTRFKTIVATGAFSLAYQPVVDLAQGSLHHFEALARFDPSGSPAESIRLAEELDMIVDFDLAVVQAVAKALEASETQVRIAANVSACSIAHEGFVNQLVAVTAANPQLRARLFLEITETQKIQDHQFDQVNASLAALKKLGHPICMDDFGAGAASLDYLRQLDVDYVKIDGRFIQGLVAGGRDAVVLKHVTALCRELGMTTVAEMVETREALEVCRDLGVNLGQGWVFSKPLAAPRWTPPKPVQKPKPAMMRGRRAGKFEEWG